METEKKHSNEPVGKNGIALNFTYCRASTTTKNIKKKTNEKSFAIDENTKWQRGNTKFVQFACDNIKTNEPKRFSFLLLFLL